VCQAFAVIDIPPDAPAETEHLGTKEKFWFQDASLGSCLFKKARSGTGEDWSEKIAAELCKLLGLPHANCELATFNGQNGTVSPSFIPDGGSLSLGNEVLSQSFASYPKSESSPSQHTVDRVFQTLNKLELHLPQKWDPPDGITCVAEVFLGYLLLDAWIGNTDRHHENWGIILLSKSRYLAPTYDHASSLGRNLSNTERLNRLSTKDRGYSVEAFVEKALSCLYRQSSDNKPLKVHDAFCQAAQLYPQAACVWLEKLSQISSDRTLELFGRVPCQRISPVAIEFAQTMLEINKHRLVKTISQL
jgi:hypothetical protein